MAEAFEVRLSQVLPRRGRGDSRIDPDAGHAPQGLVRDPYPRQLAVPCDRLRHAKRRAALAAAVSFFSVLLPPLVISSSVRYAAGTDATRPDASGAFSTSGVPHQPKSA